MAANLRIPTNVTAPKVINVRLVYAEDLFLANIFRFLFDIALAFEMAIAGATYGSLSPASTDRKVMLWVGGIAAGIFLAVNILFMLRARRDS